MRVGNMARAIDHECPRYGKYPLAAGISFLEIDAGTLQHVFRGVIHFKGEAELLRDLPVVIDQDRKRRAGGTGIVRGNWRGLWRHRDQGSVGVRQQRSSFEQPTEVNITVSAPGATIEDHNQRREFVLGKMLGQTPRPRLCRWQRKVRCRVADTNGVGSRAQRLGSRVDLASKQEVRLLDAASCDQLIGEFGKGSSNGDGKALVSTFFAHVSCSVAISRYRRPAYAGCPERAILSQPVRGSPQCGMSERRTTW